MTDPHSETLSWICFLFDKIYNLRRVNTFLKEYLSTVLSNLHIPRFREVLSAAGGFYTHPLSRIIEVVVMDYSIRWTIPTEYYRQR